LIDFNDFITQTGVNADAGGAGAETRLYTDAFRVDPVVDVTSNTAATVARSGIGTTKVSGLGDDIEVTIGGKAYTGQEKAVTAMGGAEKGFTISITEDTDPATTETGLQGIVDFVDESLSFQIGPNANQNAQIAINKADAAGVPSNQFTHLGGI